MTIVFFYQGKIIKSITSKNYNTLFLKKKNLPIISLQLCIFIKYFCLKKLFLAALDLHCCMWVFSSCSKLGLLFVEVLRLLTAVASLVEERGL